MMITYDPHSKNTHNLNIVGFEIFRNSKYNFIMFKFQESFVRCKWVIMCMTYEHNCGL
jgi:hypothetical protein